MAGSISAALELPFDEAIAYLRDKADVSTDHWTDVWRQAHARSFMVAGAAGDALVGDLHKAVRRGLEEGTTLSTFRADFDAIVAKHGWTGWTGEGSAKGRAWRTRIIYETNLSMAYAAGRYAQMTEPETLAAFPFWQYVHSGSQNPRHQHLAWNGLTLRADDPFWQTHYPPNGWGCGCRVRPVSARGLARMGKRGPDTAPPKETREWVNPKTGDKHQVPKGIDPGFDYNPGAAWKGSPQIPGSATTTAPAGFDPKVAPEKIEALARDVLAGRVEDGSRTLVAARLPEEAAARIGATRRDVEVSAFRVAKVAGRAEKYGGFPSTPHPEIGAREWGMVGDIVANGEMHHDPPRPDRPHEQVIFHRTIEGRRLMLVVRLTRERGAERLVIPTFQETGRRRVTRTTKRLETIERAPGGKA